MFASSSEARNNEHLDDMGVVDHFEILDLTSDTGLRLRILGVDSCFADAFEGDPLAS